MDIQICIPKRQCPSEYRDILYQHVKTDKILLIADQHFNHGRSNERLGMLYNSNQIIAGFNGTRNTFDSSEYPYTSMILNNEGRHEIEVGVNNKSMVFTRP